MERKKQNKRKRINKKRAFLTLSVTVMIILGIIKIGDMILASGVTEVKNISIVEVNEGMGKSVKANIVYKNSYLEDFKYKKQIPLTKEEQKFMWILAKDYGLSYEMVLALIEKESNFEREIVSSTDDYGLMQINSQNFIYLEDRLNIPPSGVIEPFNNIRSGLYILANLKDKYHDEAMVLMAYNMGEAGAKKLWKEGIYETRYTLKIMEAEKKYKKLFNEPLKGV